MSTIEELTAERDALKVQNHALTEQAKQLFGDLTRLRAQGGGGKAYGGALGGTNGGAGKVSRNVAEAMSPGARDMFMKAGGTVVD